MPWPWAGTGRAPPRAAITRSATRLEVSTLPGTTAAGASAFSRQPRGAVTSIGRWAPAQGGASGSVRDAYREERGGFRHREGTVEVALDLGIGAGEVEAQGLAVEGGGDPQRDVVLAAVGGVVLEEVLGPIGAVGERGEGGAGAALGVGEDLGHPLAQAGGPVALGELRQPQPPDPVGGLLGAQVGEALARVAHPGDEAVERRGGRAGGRDHHALLIEAAGEGGHRTGVGPPTSAWWARAAAKPKSSPAMKTGETRVMSGRWVPPR